jgi:hypothetical protein
MNNQLYDVDAYSNTSNTNKEDYPYVVVHPDALFYPPTFKEWKEALLSQVRWNCDLSGHRARKRQS